MSQPISLEPEHATLGAIMPFFVIEVFANQMDVEAMSLAIPAITEQFELSKSTAQWVMTIFFLVTASAAIPIGRLGDKYGCVRVLQVCALLASFIQVFGVFTTNSFVGLLILRLLEGFFVSGILSNKNTMARIYPPPDKAKKFLQVNVLITSICGTLTPVITGVIIDSWGWEYNFTLCSILNGLLLLYSFFITNPARSNKSQQFDILGAVFLILTIATFCLFFTFIAQKQYWESVLSFLLAILFGLLYDKQERKCSDPITPIFLLENPVVDMFFVQIFNFLISAAYEYIVPEYTAFKGISSTLTSVFEALSSLFTILGAIFIPQIQKKFINRSIILIILIIQTVALIVLIVTIENTICFFVFCIIAMVCCESIQTMLFPLLLMCAPPRFASQLGALPTTGRTIGQSISFCLFGGIIQLINGKQETLEKEYLAIRVCCGITIAVVVVIAFMFWFRIGMQKTEAQKKGFKKECLRILVIPDSKQIEEQKQLLPDDKDEEKSGKEVV